MSTATLHPHAPDQRTVRDLRKNKREIARIQLRTFEGVRLIDVRAYIRRDDGEMLATKKGLSLRIECLQELISALEEGSAIARQMGWLAPAPAQRKVA